MTLQATGGETFQGFLVQSRLVADNTTRVGVFATNDPNSRLSSCPVNTVIHTIVVLVNTINTFPPCLLLFHVQDGITHSNENTPRTSVAMQWTAPPVGTGPIQFGLVMFIIPCMRNVYLT